MVPGLKAEDVRRPSRSPLRSACSDDLKPGDCEMVVDGGGHFSPAVIDGVHTCLLLFSTHTANSRAEGNLI